MLYVEGCVFRSSSGLFKAHVYRGNMNSSRKVSLYYTRTPPMMLVIRVKSITVYFIWSHDLSFH